MKKLIMSLVAAGALVFASVAVADHSVVAVTDPTPDGTFTGQYATGQPDDPETTQDESTGTQQGYVGVYSDGVVACNGNPAHTRPDDGSELVGYIWVGPGQAASNKTASAPGDAAGAGNNHTDANGNPTGDSPCPDADPTGVNE